MNVNLRGGRALLSKQLFSLFVSRGFFWTLTFGWMAPILIYLFVWITAVGAGHIKGFDRLELINYYLCLLVINQLTYPVSNWTVGDVIRNGIFSSWLLRPVHPIFEAIASDIAVKMVCMPFCIVIVVLLVIILHPVLILSWSSALLFLPALILSQCLRFLQAYVLALLALWQTRSDALQQINTSLIFFLSGQVAPIALLPDILQKVAFVLPYRYMLSFPIEVLLGRLSFNDLVIGFMYQIGWLLIFVILHQFMWKRGIRHYTAVGG